jgi:hypothetical protein
MCSADSGSVLGPGPGPGPGDLGEGAVLIDVEPPKQGGVQGGLVGAARRDGGAGFAEGFGDGQAVVRRASGGAAPGPSRWGAERCPRRLGGCALRLGRAGRTSASSAESWPAFAGAAGRRVGSQGAGWAQRDAVVAEPVPDVLARPAGLSGDVRGAAAFLGVPAAQPLGGELGAIRGACLATLVRALPPGSSSQPVGARRRFLWRHCRA